MITKYKHIFLLRLEQALPFYTKCDISRRCLVEGMISENYANFKWGFPDEIYDLNVRYIHEVETIFTITNE